MADEIKEIYRVLARNQAIAEKFFRIESEILTISNYRDFFDRLMASVQDVFDIPTPGSRSSTRAPWPRSCTS